MTFKYKNISGSDLALMGFGLVKAGESILTDKQFNNPNFALQFDGDDKVGVEAQPELPTKKTRKGHNK